MTDRGGKKKLHPQSSSRMLLGLSDENQVIPYENKEKVLENLLLLTTMFDYFCMLPIMMNHLQKQGYRNIYEEFANSTSPIEYTRPKDVFLVEDVED
jgi:hypothetical protein